MKDRKLENIFLIQYNIEALRIAYVNYNIGYLEKFLKPFIMDLTMMIILSSKSQQKNLKNNLFAEKKTVKNTLLFQFY